MKFMIETGEVLTVGIGMVLSQPSVNMVASHVDTFAIPNLAFPPRYCRIP